MRMVVIGDLADVTGFALAGVPGIVCATAAEVQAAIDGAFRRHDGVVMVSASVAAAAPAAIDAARARRTGPLILVLPSQEGAEVAS